MLALWNSAVRGDIWSTAATSFARCSAAAPAKMGGHIRRLPGAGQLSLRVRARRGTSPSDWRTGLILLSVLSLTLLCHRPTPAELCVRETREKNDVATPRTLTALKGAERFPVLRSFGSATPVRVAFELATSRQSDARKHRTSKALRARWNNVT